ncbi:MAG: SDR family NAD(P)-dependent oxidoreductase [bacterium]
MAGNMAVFVTGASSGVGKACTLLFSGLGYTVYAGVRRQEDGDLIQRHHPDLIFPVIVDLEQQQTIDRAVEYVTRAVEGKGLQGLVNCAGTILSGPIEYFPREQWVQQYDVNVFGTMALTSAMLPLLRNGQGRIINIGAVGGGIALPFFGAIASAKIAFEAINDCLRRELHPWGIHVVIIEPGGINTPANDKMRDSVGRFLENTEPLARQRYGKPMETFTRWAYQKHIHNLQPEQVAQTVLRAFKARYPKTRYRLGWDSRAVALATRFVPDRILDRFILWISTLPIRFGAWNGQKP